MIRVTAAACIVISCCSQGNILKAFKCRLVMGYLGRVLLLTVLCLSLALESSQGKNQASIIINYSMHGELNWSGYFLES